MSKNWVVIEVNGGIAEVTANNCPGGVTVVIYDHDCAAVGDEETATYHLEADDEFESLEACLRSISGEDEDEDDE